MYDIHTSKSNKCYSLVCVYYIHCLLKSEGIIKMCQNILVLAYINLVNVSNKLEINLVYKRY